MIRSHLELIALVLIPLLSIAGCGGGETKDDDDGAAETDTTSGSTSGAGDKQSTSDIAIPGVVFLMPLPASSALHLTKMSLNTSTTTEPNPDSMLTEWVTRINENVTHLNEDIDRMNRDHKDAIVALEDDTYDYQAVVCEGDKVAIVMKWSADGKRISSERDLNQKPDAPEDVRVRTVYDASTEDKTLSMQFMGVPAGQPEGADGPRLASFDEARQLAAGSYTIRGVQDWHAEGVEELAPDDYLTGALDADGNGEFVGWSKRVNACAAVTSFNESAPDADWCNSRKIGDDAWYTADEAEAAWSTRLKPIGVAPASNLDAVTITATCPAAK